MAAVTIEHGVDLTGRLAGLDTAVDAVAAVDPALVHHDELGSAAPPWSNARPHP
ncbi:MAG TPA: hypothetical protein VHF25_06310 [Nitriliruptorales bacterium]|nr:hypothetical protein [Nitriliruptorales bacterium]